MTTKGIVDGGTNIIAVENFRKRPRLVACEDDLHEAVNMDVLSELGVEGQFHRPGSGEIGIMRDPDFAWLGPPINRWMESPVPR
jgi:hypothetical protein